MNQCKSCQAPILWVIPEKKNGTYGTVMPLDPIPSAAKGTYIKLRVDPNGDKIVRWLPQHERAAGKLLYTPHWATCPHADEHRKPR